MTTKEALNKYKYLLPQTTTVEDLKCDTDKSVLTFGDYVVVSRYFYNPKGNECYFGAVYRFVSAHRICSSPLELIAASDLEFKDDGSAILWAIQQASF